MRYLIILIAISLASCSYEKRLNKWCARCPQKDSVSVIKKDSVDKKLTVRDTSGKVDGKDGPEFSFVFGEDCDSIKKAFKHLQENPIIITMNGINATASMDRSGKLKIKTSTNPYEILFKGALRELYIYKGAYHESVKREVIEKPCENERTRFDGLTFWWFWVTFPILLLWIAYKWLKWRYGG